VQRNLIQAANAEREQRPLILEPTELALDGGAALVELPPAGRLARDQRMQTVSLAPSPDHAAP